MSTTSPVTRLAITYYRVVRKLVAQMMIYDYAFCVFRFYDGRPTTASLINDNDILGTCLCHRLTLKLFMDIRSFLYEMYRDQGWIKAQCDQRAVDNNPSAQPIRILVWNNQSALLR
jgi:hypothetical protein